MTDERDPAHAGEPGYAVGYGRPPLASRFQKGRSGNPRGRPRKVKRDYRGSFGVSWLEEIVLDEAYRELLLRENGEVVTVTAMQAAMRALVVGAAKGQRLHARLLIDLVERVEARQAQQRHAALRDALAYKEAWAAACQLATERGLPAPAPGCPHPDDLVIDTMRGTVRLDGPATAAEQAAVVALCVERDRLLRCLDVTEPAGADTGGMIAEVRQRLANLDAQLPQRLAVLPPAHDQREREQTGGPPA